MLKLTITTDIKKSGQRLMHCMNPVLKLTITTDIKKKWAAFDAFVQNKAALEYTYILSIMSSPMERNRLKFVVYKKSNSK